YELCAGQAPYADEAVERLREVVLARPPRRVSEVADIDARLALVIDRCLAADPAQRFASGEELREALEQLLPHTHAPAPDGNPYRGLRSFEAEHGALFFGRDAEVRALVERLRSDSFVLVAGSSGAGKSSLCRAAVLPAVLAGAVDEKR